VRYVGLDVHLRQSTICVLDKQGRKIASKTIHGPWAKVRTELSRIRRPFALCFEASVGYGFVYEQLRGLARHVVVAHPGKLRLIFRSKRKNDRVDAEKLAKLLYLDEVPSVHVPAFEVRSWRGAIEHRRRLIMERTRVKNGLRSLLRGLGIESPNRGMWTRRGLAWLRTVDLGSDLNALRRDQLLERLESLDRMVRQAERVLNRTARWHPGMTLLQTIPGVGPRTAEALIAYVDDPGRFRRSKAIGSYLGLVPCQDASAGTNRLGHITKEGPASVRQLLVQASWCGIRLSEQIRARYERITRGDKIRKRIAIVATAHYLARTALAMLQTGEVWRYDRAA
jgi:transposase